MPLDWTPPFDCNALRDLPDGRFVRTVFVDGLAVTIRGFFKDGVAVIGTIEKW